MTEGVGMRLIRQHLTTIVVAMITAMVTAGAPAIAHGVHAAFAHNADKVDNRHAVGSGASLANARGRLVAHNSGGRLPARFIPKVKDSNKLDGLDSTVFQRNCTDGAFLASGFVDASAVTGALAITGLDNVYSCLGDVTVREDSTGIYTLRFEQAVDGLFATFTPRVLLTARAGIGNDNFASYNTYIEGGFVHVQVVVTDPDTAAPIEDDFNFVVTDLDCSGIICSIVILGPQQQAPGADATTTERSANRRDTQ